MTLPSPLSPPLSPSELSRYRDVGYIELPQLLSRDEVRRLKDEVVRLAGVDDPGRVLERDGRLVRALHGSHLTSDVCRRLTELPRMVSLAESVVGGPVYVYQFKINFKASFGGDVWPWHQDYIFWRDEDGMPAPHVVNIIVFVDEVTEFNGPLMIIPGSHKHGVIDARVRETTPGGWLPDVSADLKYSLDAGAVGTLAGEGGIVAPKGEAGTGLLFHPNLAHASVPNLSPFDRTMLIVTYNRVDNVPLGRGPARPGFLVSRDTTPVVAGAETL